MLHNGRLLGPGTVFRFRFLSSANNSVSTVSNWTAAIPDHVMYDSEGAIYYVLAILIMFGCTILLMFCSFVRKKHDDNSIITYMRDLDRLERLQLKQEKFRTNLQIHQKKVHRILGPDRAEVLDETISPSPSMQHADMFGWDPDMLSADADSRRPSSASLGTIIICADDLQQEKGLQQHRRLSAPDRRLSAPARRLSAPASDPPSRTCTLASLSTNSRPSRTLILNGSAHKPKVGTNISSTIPIVRVHVYE